MVDFPIIVHVRLRKGKNIKVFQGFIINHCLFVALRGHIWRSSQGWSCQRQLLMLLWKIIEIWWNSRFSSDSHCSLTYCFPTNHHQRSMAVVCNSSPPVAHRGVDAGQVGRPMCQQTVEGDGVGGQVPDRGIFVAHFPRGFLVFGSLVCWINHWIEWSHIKLWTMLETTKMDNAWLISNFQTQPLHAFPRTGQGHLRLLANCRPPGPFFEIRLWAYLQQSTDVDRQKQHIVDWCWLYYCRLLLLIVVDVCCWSKILMQIVELLFGKCPFLS